MGIRARTAVLDPRDCDQIKGRRFRGKECELNSSTLSVKCLWTTRLVEPIRGWIFQSQMEGQSWAGNGHTGVDLTSEVSEALRCAGGLPHVRSGQEPHPRGG